MKKALITPVQSFPVHGILRIKLRNLPDGVIQAGGAGVPHYLPALMLRQTGGAGRAGKTASIWQNCYSKKDTKFMECSTGVAPSILVELIIKE